MKTFPFLRTWIALVLVFGAALVVGGGSAPVHTVEAGASRVDICHNNGTNDLSVSENAIAGGHFISLAQYEASSYDNPLGPHGDYKGKCVTTVPTQPPVTETVVPTQPPPTVPIPVTITVTVGG